jgi:hypothetical protein
LTSCLDRLVSGRSPLSTDLGRRVLLGTEAPCSECADEQYCTANRILLLIQVVSGVALNNPTMVRTISPFNE